MINYGFACQLHELIIITIKKNYRVHYHSWMTLYFNIIIDLHLIYNIKKVI
jgi:hypothetical protein